MINITFIVPYPELVIDVNQVFAQHPLRNRLNKRVDVIGAEDLDEFFSDLNTKSDVLVARGYTAQRLEEKKGGTPIVILPITAYDIIRAVDECVKAFKPKCVALVGYYLSPGESEAIESLFPCRFKTYMAHTVNDIEASVTKALRDGCDAIIGGHSVNLCAASKHVPSITIKTGEAAIRQALDEAIRTVEIISYERERAEMFTTITNSAKDGILYVTNDLFIRVANPVCARFCANTQELVGRKLTEVFPFMTAHAAEVLAGEREIENHLYKHCEIPMSINYFPVVVRGRVTGVVITIQDVTKIQNLETQIRQKLSEKGLEARYQFEDIIHVSPIIDQLIETARRYAGVSSNILIEGETGTGKELLAQSVHNTSARQNGPFVAVNCAAIPENLLESEMFGYTEGAFTGSAKGGKIGLFELAHNGTLFLDEISELPLSFQSKFLRVLQEREVRPVGAGKVKSVDVRIIAASNCSLKEHVKKGLFRQDLFYRLDVLKLFAPPLRRRPEDIEVLFQHFLHQYNAGRTSASILIEPRALELLQEYEFAGNIREMKNIAERVSILCMDSCMVTIEAMHEALYIEDMSDVRPHMAAVPLRSQNISDERTLILDTLRTHAFNQSVAARALGIDRTTLWRKMQKYAIPKHE